MRSASSAPPWLNMSSNDCSRAASISRTASPRLPITSARPSALSRNWSVTRLLRWTMVSVMRAPVCSSLETTSPPRRLRSSTSELPVFLSVLFTSSTRLEIVSASRLPVSTTSSVSSCGAVGHHVEDRRRLLREALGHAVEPHRHHVLQIGGDLGELVADVIGLEVERRGQPVAGRRDRLAGLLAGVLEAVEQVAAALAERLDHAVAGGAERAGDVLALLGQRMGDAPRGLVDLLGHQLADLGNVVAEIEMDAVDGVADLLGLADQRVALAAEILQQRRGCAPRCRCRRARARTPRSPPASRARRRAPARARCRRPWRRPRAGSPGRR